MIALAPTLSFDDDVIAAQRGDRDAFSRLVDATRNAVCAIVVAIVRDVAASEDVAQDVYLSAWQGVSNLHNPASFLPWLRQLARNQAHFFARTRGRRRRRQADEGDELLAAASDPSPGARDRLLSREEQAIVADVLEQLPDDARGIVTLYYREGRSARQVADLLGLRQDAVKKRLERARTTLRREVLERFADVARRTAPGAAFTAGVAAAVAMGTPATAAAATASGIGGASKLAVGLGGAGVGLLAGLAGVVIGLRGNLRRARDAQERRELRTLALASAAVVIALCAAIWGSALLKSPTALVGSWLVLAPIHVYLYVFRLPRIVARRHAAELGENPTAARRHLRERLCVIVGVLVGVGVGTATIVWAAYALSRA